MSNKISYAGFTEAQVIHALYHGTQPQGMGFLHNKPDLSVAGVQEILDQHDLVQKQIFLDYFLGRPLKCSLDTERKTIDRSDLYDRDAGPGTMERVLIRLRATQVGA